MYSSWRPTLGFGMVVDSLPSKGSDSDSDSEQHDDDDDDDDDALTFREYQQFDIVAG